MTYQQDIENKISEAMDMIEELRQELKKSTDKVSELERSIETINEVSGNNPATSPVNSNAIGSLGVKEKEFLFSGPAKMVGVTLGEGATGEIDLMQFAIGKDPASINARKSRDMEILFQHQYGTNVSFFAGRRDPIYTNFNDNTSSVSVTFGGTTLTDSVHGWTSNELQDAYVNIYDNTKTYICTRKIASNTSTALTITGTWPNTVTGCFYLVWFPVYIGITQFPWQRGYFMEGTNGGVRFGIDPTANGQNGLLYMDSTGDLYWRNKGGTSTKLN